MNMLVLIVVPLHFNNFIDLKINFLHPIKSSFSYNRVILSSINVIAIIITIVIFFLKQRYQMLEKFENVNGWVQRDKVKAHVVK